MITQYNALLGKYGKQGWWPLSKDSLESKHYRGRPKNDNDKFEIVVGAILTQNTSWTNVEKALKVLLKMKVCNLDSIFSIDEKKLADLIKPAGYYNQKASYLKHVATFFKKNSFEDLSKMKLQDLRPLILDLKGIGPETCDSIILYALEKPIFVIDAYTRRIFSRLGYLNESKDYNEWQKLFMESLNHDVELFKEYHALIVRHAKEHCQKKPKCKGCCLKKTCNFN